MTAEIARLKKAIAKLERRIKAKKPLPSATETSWDVRHTMLVARLERLQEEVKP